MHRLRICFFTICCSIIIFALQAGPVLGKAEGKKGANGFKNLQIYPKDVDKKQLKAEMKVYAKALGLTCKGCHDIKAFEKDTAMKSEAREMMTMTQGLNEQMKADGFKAEVTCNTCHRGKEHPAK